MRETAGAIGGPIFHAANSETNFSLDPGLGLGGDIEYHLNPRIGLMASLILATVEAELMYDTMSVWEDGESDFDYLSVTLGPNFHLTPERRVDLYVGLFVGVADLGGTTIRVPSRSFRVDLGNELIFGGLLGLDVPFGRHSMIRICIGPPLQRTLPVT